MIIHAILKALLTVASWPIALFSRVGNVQFSWEWVDGLLDSLDIVFFLFPVYDLMPLIFLLFVLMNVRLVIAIVKLILYIIPLY